MAIVGKFLRKRGLTVKKIIQENIRFTSMDNLWWLKVFKKNGN
jgi:hypothetical protein